MKLKQYLTLGIGVAVGFGVSVVGVSYASKNITKSVKLITSEQAKSIMLNKVPGANFIEFSYDGDDMKPKYDGTLIKDNSEYEIDVDAKTGQIIKCEKEVIAISNNNANQNTSNNTTTNNNASATSTSNTNTNTNKNNTTTSSNKTNTTTISSSYIGSSKAKSIMLNKVPGATVKSFSFDGDGTPEYDGELIKDGYEYDISVDAKTGAIKEFSKERIDRYDDDKYDNDYDDDDRYDDDRYDNDYDDDDDDRYDD